MKRPLKQQMGLLLDDELKERLEKACAANGRSAGAEIRARLALSFEEDALDEQTRELRHYLARLARAVRTWTHLEWSAHPAAFQAFMRALVRQLEDLRPPGEAIFKPEDLPKPGSGASVTQPVDPEALGVALQLVDRERMRTLDARHEEIRRELLKRYPEYKKSD
jgi:hypothetical protein